VLDADRLAAQQMLQRGGCHSSARPGTPAVPAHCRRPRRPGGATGGGVSRCRGRLPPKPRVFGTQRCRGRLIL